jgi:hypothetical protein
MTIDYAWLQALDYAGVQAHNYARVTDFGTDLK